ncbi:MAG: PAS domain S-box protein, partial [Opitutaceae bacterium]
ELLRQVCRAFVDKGSYGFAWAGLDTREGKPQECVAHWSADAGLKAVLESSGGGSPVVSLAEVSLKENRIVVFNDLIGDPGAQGWGEAAVRLGFHSAAAFPLRERGSAIGSIALYSFEQNAFSTREVSLLKAAVEDISYAFDNFQREIERVQTQADLKQSEQRFRRLFEQAPVAYLTLDPDARILDTNHAWHAMLGEHGEHEPAKSSRSFSDHLAPIYRESFPEKFKAFIAAKRDRSMDLELIGSGGQRVSASVEIHVETDAQGVFKQAHCVVFDVTERREFEAALQASEERLTLAFEVANDGIWDMDLRTGQGYLSHRYFTMLGYAPGEFPGGLDHWRSIVHPDDFPRTEAAFQGFLGSSSDEFACEHRMRARDGSWKWVLCRGRAVEKDKEGRKLRVLGTNSDITARKAAEEALLETVHRYSSYISESPLSILAMDDQGNICEANPASCSVFGFSEAEMKTHTLINLLEGSSTASGRRMLAQILKTGRTEGEVRGRRKNGTLLHFSLVGATVSPKRHLLFCQDVTAKRRMELALQSREAMLESILHTAMDGFWILDMEGRILEVNESYCALSGYTHKELLQMRFLDLEGVENLSAIQQHIERIRRMGSDRWETSHRRKDGSLVDIEINAAFLTVDGGRIVVFLQNISERKRAEIALRQSQKRLSLIIEGSSLAAWDWNLSTGEIVFNGYWARLLGCGEDEMSLTADEFMKMQHPDDAARVGQHIRDHFEGRSGAIDCEYRLRHKNGSWLWIMDRGQVIARDPAGKPLRATGTQRDVTERHLAQERVRQQAALLDQTCDIVFATDVGGALRYCNRSAEMFLGSTSAACEGKSLEFLLSDAHPSFGSELIRTVLSTGEWHGEIAFESGARTGRIWDSRWSVVPAAEGHSIIVLMVNTDVTEKRMLESRFLRSQRMESIGALATGISHDLNNIFLPISLASRMLRQGPTEEQRSSLFDMLDKSAQRGADIVQQLLTFSKGVEGQRSELQPRLLLVEMQKIVRETFPKNISLQCELPEDLWTIAVDPIQIHQVLLNLCVNARDAMPEGGVLTLSGENILFDEYYAAMNPEADTGPYIVMTVGDTGVGIPPERLEKIFDPFFTTKESGKGTGLGLSTAHGIVKSHGGFIQVRSKPGQGSSFKIYFPAVPNLVAVEEEPALDEVPLANGETILVVDDEEAIRETLRHMLEKQGYRTLVTADGRQGMVCFVQQRARVRAVVTDIMMPVMDGAELIRAIRSVDPVLPIIAMSGLPEKELSTCNMGAQANHFLIKPFVSEQLLSLLHSQVHPGTAIPRADTRLSEEHVH